MNIKIQEASAKSFIKYGKVVELNPLSKASIKTDQVTFWKQRASYLIKNKTEIGVLKVKKSEMVFSELENHFITPTVLIPIYGDFVMAVAGPSDKITSAKKVEAFHFSRDQLVVLNPKAWHGVTYPLKEKEITLLVIFGENTLDKDTIYEALDEQCNLIF